MALAILFLLGIGNFAMHQAVLESRHRLLGGAPWFVHMLGQRRLGLGVEFVILLGSMFMVADGATSWAWGYGIYSLANGAAAWLILSGRV